MAKKTKKVVTEKDGMFVELNGKVSLIEKKNGKVVKRDVLSSDVVLEAFLAVLSDALDNFIANQEAKITLKKKSEEVEKVKYQEDYTGC